METKPSQHFLEIITENKVFFQKKVEEMENCFAQSNYEEMGNCYSELKHFFIQKFDLLNQETQQVKQVIHCFLLLNQYLEWKIWRGRHDQSPSFTNVLGYSRFHGYQSIRNMSKFD